MHCADAPRALGGRAAAACKTHERGEAWDRHVTLRAWVLVAGSKGRCGVVPAVLRPEQLRVVVVSLWDLWPCRRPVHRGGCQAR